MTGRAAGTGAGQAARTSILMYHSISDRGGATAIAPDLFEMQMRLLAESGVPVLSLDDWLAARTGAGLPPRSVVITFDDGFEDFDARAWPVMRRLGFRPIVYLPTAYVGGEEGWSGIASPPRRVMDWERISTLADEGVLFGSHTVSHPNLDELSPDALNRELIAARSEIEGRLNRPVRHFAPPYGLASREVRRRIADHYRTSVGTRLAEANAGADLHDLPRIEMFYFSDPGRWRAHLAGGGRAYLARRRLLRRVRAAVLKPWQGQ